VKFQLLVRDKRDGSEPNWESYDEHGINTREQAMGWGTEVVLRFNNTLRPHECARELLDARIVGEGKGSVHAYSKQNLYTLSDHRGHFDLVKCTRCGVVARRYGVDRLVRQTPYRAKKFQYCGPTSPTTLAGSRRT